MTDPLLNFQTMPVYNNMAWPGMFVSLLGGNLIPTIPGTSPVGINPRSGKQAIVAVPHLAGLLNPFTQSGSGNLITNLPALANPSTAFQGSSGNMTVNFLGSTLNSFDLLSFWFACSLTTFNTPVTVPQACSLDVYGYKAGMTNVPPAVATFVFWGNSFVKADMTQAVLPSSFTSE